MSAKQRRLTLALLAFCLAQSPALAAISPEQETAALAKLLKPIADDRWKEIAGARISETYEIAAKDTLWDISQRLFGDPKYWPKIWALNNSGITNPHLILPGRKIAFMPGTGSDLPAVTVSDSPQPQPGMPADSGENAPVPGTKGVGGSEEWRQLPPQRWEEVDVKLPSAAQVDPLGFDRRNRVTFAGPKGFEQELIAQSESLDGVGRIIGARTTATTLSTNDIVYVRATGDLQEGGIYNLTRAPSKLEGSREGRRGFSYPILGRIKVLQHSGDDYVARILSARDEIFRGDFLIPVFPRIPELNLIPGPSAMEGTIMLDPRRSTRATAQHRIAFVDRGSEDGIRPGMVFRAFTTFDPVSKRDLEANNLTARADLMITQVSSGVSSGIMISSSDVVNNGARVTLLTDVSSLVKGHGTREQDVEGNTINQNSDELDKLDNGGALSPEDEKELEQLENHKEDGSSGESVPPPSDGETPKAPSTKKAPAPQEEVPSPEDLAPTAPMPEAPQSPAAPTQGAEPAVPAPTETAAPAPTPAPVPAPAAPQGEPALPPPPAPVEPPTP